MTITDTTLTIERRQQQIDTEAALDGIYVLRTNVPTHTLDAPARGRGLQEPRPPGTRLPHHQGRDLNLRPIHHRLEDRVRAHVLIAMLTAYLVWHLRRTWAPLTYTDQHPPQRDNPVAPAKRSKTADRKASRHRDEHDQPVRSLRALLEHLATLTRNDIRYNTTDNSPLVPTPTQRQAFELLQTPIPLTLK